MTFAVIMSEGGALEVGHLPEEVRRSEPSAVSGAGAGMREELSEIERNKILDALERENGNQTRAAQLLGISRRNMVYKLAKYGIRR